MLVVKRHNPLSLVARLGPLVFLAAAPVPATNPADAPAKTVEELKQQEREALKTDMARLQSIGAHDVNEVVRFSFEAERLVPLTDLPFTEGPRAMTIKGKPGAAQVNVIKGHAPGRGAENNVLFLQLIYRDLSLPDVIMVQTQILSSPNLVQVAQDFELPGGVTRSIALLEAPRDQGAEAVQLRVQEISDAGGDAVNVRLTADSFPDLRRKYPAEVDRYLRPIFRELDQEDRVFATDAKTAWQVVGAGYTPDPAMLAAVRADVDKLNSDQFAAREAAVADLKKFGEPAALILSGLDRSKLSDEQKARVDAFLKGFHPLDDAHARQLADDRNFLLDCLYTDDPTIRTLALVRLAKLVGHDLPFDMSLTGKDRAAAVFKLRAQLTPTTMPSTLPLPAGLARDAQPSAAQ